MQLMLTSLVLNVQTCLPLVLLLDTFFNHRLYFSVYPFDVINIFFENMYPFILSATIVMRPYIKATTQRDPLASDLDPQIRATLPWGEGISSPSCLDWNRS